MIKFKYLIGDKEYYIPIAESYKDCMTLVKSDYYRLSGKSISSYKIIKKIIRGVLFTNRGFFNIWLRFASYHGCLYSVCERIYQNYCDKYSIFLPSSTKIGYGLYLSHGMSMVINEGTIIGNNVNLSHLLSVGTNHNTPAIIGDNTYIGPSVCVVENVTIGCGCTIGAGSVITRNIPNNATAAGSPAKVLNFNNPGRYIGNPYPSFCQEKTHHN